MNNLSNLFENNRTWTDQVTEQKPDFFDNLSKGQQPVYLWIGCADSRVPATVVTGLKPGDLFVHRNIANVIVHADSNSQSVIQYAVQVLKVKHVIVCGHYGCGGVQAAMESESYGLIDQWLGHIRDVYSQHKEEVESIASEKERFDRMCELNVQAQVMNVCHSPFVQKAWRDGQELTVHGLIYSLTDGRLKDLEIAVSSADETSAVFRHK